MYNKGGGIGTLLVRDRSKTDGDIIPRNNAKRSSGNYCVDIFFLVIIFMWLCYETYHWWYAEAFQVLREMFSKNAKTICFHGILNKTFCILQLKYVA